VAGRLVAAVDGTPSAAERVGRTYQTSLEPLAESEDGARLRATGQEPDIAWSARKSALEVSTRSAPRTVGWPW
jgi:hypothetical protein